MTEHTPTPWHKSFRGDFVQIASRGVGPVCQTSSRDWNTDVANAEFIVLAVNAHDELLGAIDEAIDAFMYEGSCPPDEAQRCPQCHAMSRLLAAIAKAKGGTP